MAYRAAGASTSEHAPVCATGVPPDCSEKSCNGLQDSRRSFCTEKLTSGAIASPPTRLLTQETKGLHALAHQIGRSPYSVIGQSVHRPQVYRRGR